MVGAVDSEGFLHIVDVRRDRWDGAKIVEAITIILAIKWHAFCGAKMKILPRRWTLPPVKFPSYIFYFACLTLGAQL